MKMKLIAGVCFLMLNGCRLSGFKAVPKEQLNTDIGSKTVKTESGSDWVFSGDSKRCFVVNEDETRITDSQADVSVTVASWRDITIGNSALYRSVFGKMTLHYKMVGGKWFLENVESKELIEKTLEREEFKKFVDIQIPLCKYYRHVS